MTLGSRNVWIVVGFVVVYLVLPSLHVDLSTSAIVAAFVVFLAGSLLVDLLQARQRAAAREKAAAATPVVAGGLVFVSAAGHSSPSYTGVDALGANTGQLIWRSPAGVGGADGVAVAVG